MLLVANVARPAQPRHHALPGHHQHREVETHSTFIISRSIIMFNIQDQHEDHAAHRLDLLHHPRAALLQVHLPLLP